jgi:hypothetical protein
MVDAREVRATGLAAALLSGYSVIVLSTGLVDFGEFAEVLGTYLGGSFVLWLLIGITLGMVRTCVAAKRSGKESFLLPFLRDGIRARWERDYGLSLIWPPVLFATLMASFNAFKQMVLPLAGYGMDPVFAQADQILFLGHDPWRATHALLGSPQVTLVMDGAYHGWFVPMSLGIILCAWLGSSSYRLRTQSMRSYLGVWIGIGSVLAFVLPSAGPCFYSRLVGPSPSYDALLAALADIQNATGGSILSLKIQDTLMRVHELRTLTVGAGISAMPSVHVSLATLFALGAFRINRVAGRIFGAYAVLIWIASIHLGWHYAVDGIVGSALTVGIWFLCGRLADRLERPILAPAAEPALA